MNGLNLMRDLVRAFVRKIGYLLAILAFAALAALFTSGKASAQVGPTNATETACASGEGCDQGRAYQACLTHGAAWSASSSNTSAHGGQYQCTDQPTSTPKRFLCQIKFTTGASVGNWTNCTIPYHSYYTQCAARADLGGLYVSNFQNGAKVCSFGCEYDQATKQSDTTITDKANPSNSIRFGVLQGGKPNGNVCTNPDGSDQPSPPNDDNNPCIAVGSDSAGTIYHCPKSDGSSCTISGRGTKFCQPPPPSTQGPKADTSRQDANSQSTSPTNSPQPPAPRPGENWQPNGPGSEVCNNITGSCSQVQSYSNTGTPAPNAPPVTGDGSGANGAGQQQGSGTPSGGGSGQGTDMAPTNEILDDIRDTVKGDAGDGVESNGPLYEKSEDTLESVLGDYQARVEQSELGSAMTGFFNVPSGGSCPIFSVPASPYWNALSTDMLCVGPVHSAIVAFGYLLMACAAFFGVTRVALY